MHESGLVWQLSAAELDALWELLDLGEPPYPLELPSEGITADQREELLDELWSAMADRELVHGDRVDGFLAETLGIVHGAGTVLEAQIAADRHLRVRAARTTVAAGVLVQHADQVRVHRVGMANWCGPFVDLLPRLSPVPGQSIIVPAAELWNGLERLADGAGQGAFEDELRAAGVGAVEARWVAGLAGAAEMIGVQLSISSAAGDETISWYGTPAGAAMLLGFLDDSPWVSIVPAGRDQLAARIVEFAPD